MSQAKSEATPPPCEIEWRVWEREKEVTEGWGKQEMGGGEGLGRDGVHGRL